MTNGIPDIESFGRVPINFGIRYTLPDLSPSETRVYITLVTHRNAKTHQCNPSNALLETETRYGHRTVQEALRRLESKGLIRRFYQEKTRKNGMRYTVRHFLIVGVDHEGVPQLYGSNLDAVGEQDVEPKLAPVGSADPPGRTQSCAPANAVFLSTQRNMTCQHIVTSAVSDCAGGAQSNSEGGAQSDGHESAPRSRSTSEEGTNPSIEKREGWSACADPLSFAPRVEPSFEAHASPAGSGAGTPHTSDDNPSPQSHCVGLPQLPPARECLPAGGLSGVPANPFMSPAWVPQRNPLSHTPPQVLASGAEHDFEPPLDDGEIPYDCEEVNLPDDSDDPNEDWLR